MPHLREHASATPTARLALLSLLMCSLTSSTALTVALGPSVCLRAATPLRAVHALCSSDDGPNALLRQSEVLELLSEVIDPSLADLSGSTAGADVVTLGLVRGVSTEAGSCKLELELPQESIAAGAADRLRLAFSSLLTAQLEWVESVEVDVGTQAAARGGDDAMEWLEQAATPPQEPEEEGQAQGQRPLDALADSMASEPSEAGPPGVSQARAASVGRLTHLAASIEALRPLSSARSLSPPRLAPPTPARPLSGGAHHRCGQLQGRGGQEHHRRQPRVRSGGEGRGARGGGRSDTPRGRGRGRRHGPSSRHAAPTLQPLTGTGAPHLPPPPRLVRRWAWSTSTSTGPACRRW